MQHYRASVHNNSKHKVGWKASCPIHDFGESCLLGDLGNSWCKSTPPAEAFWSDCSIRAWCSECCSVSCVHRHPQQKSSRLYLPLSTFSLALISGSSLACWFCLRRDIGNGQTTLWNNVCGDGDHNRWAEKVSEFLIWQNLTDRPLGCCHLDASYVFVAVEQGRFLNRCSIE